MKFLRKKLDDLHEQVKPGAKYEKFYAIYEMADTFLYTPDDVTDGPTHVRDALDMKRMMIMVVVALGPCILMAMYNTGYQANLEIERLVDLGSLPEATTGNWRSSIMDAFGYNPNNLLSCFVHGALYFLPIFIVTQIAGGFWEVLFATVRGHEINEGFLVTGMLFPLTLPATVPLWQVAIGISFGVVIGKEVFGGTGKNFLNPALTGRAYLYFAASKEMTADIWVAAPKVDGYSGATSLGALADNKNTMGMGVITDKLDITWWDAFWGFIPGSMGETSTFACLLGAVILVVTQIGSWRIMVSTLIGALGSAWLFNLAVGPETPNMFLMPAHWHLVVGGLAFGLVFMATDPVSAAMTQGGKWAYGLVVGVTTTLVRVINPGYAEGIMLAILFGNVVAPLIDWAVIQLNIRRRLKRSGR